MWLHVIGFTCTYYFTFDAREENTNATEQARQKRRQTKYASFWEEKERGRAMARENYKCRKRKTPNLD